MDITRRKAVTGMIAAPLALSTVGLSETEQAVKGAGKDPYTLNVILHGMCIVAVPDRNTAHLKDGIEILIPDHMDHIRQWGKWCHETPLANQPAPYQITGVNGGNFPLSIEDLDPDSNAVLHGTGLQRKGSTALGLACSIKMPFPVRPPLSWRKVCRSGNTADFFTGDAAYYLRRPPVQISMVHVFQYTFADPNAVRYGDNKLVLADGETTFNLHIWADPADGFHELPSDINVELQDSVLDSTRSDSRHSYWVSRVTPVEDMIKAFTGFDSQQNPTYNNRTGALDTKEVIPGIQHNEKYTLTERGDCKNLTKIERTCDYTEPPKPFIRIVHCMAVFVYGS